jgi:hypothetical protein
MYKYFLLMITVRINNNKVAMTVRNPTTARGDMPKFTANFPNIGVSPKNPADNSAARTPAFRSNIIAL